MIPIRVWYLSLMSLVLVAGGMLASGVSHARTPRIINGATMTQVAFDDRWRASAQLLVVDSADDDIVPYEAYFCAGTLIDTQLVLTAAHCVQGLTPLGLRVVVGERELFSIPFVGALEVQDILVPPLNGNSFHFGVDMNEDVALIRLKEPVVGIAPMAVVSAADTASWGNGAGLPVGAEIAGWGLYNHVVLGARIPKMIRSAQVPILADSDCRSANPGYGFFAATMLCAGIPDTNPHPLHTNGVGACFGDSGSALLVPDDPVLPTVWRIAGVTSWGKGDCAEGPAVYARVDAFRGWIESIGNDSGGVNGLMPPDSVVAGTPTLHSVTVSWNPPAAGPAPVSYAVFREVGVRVREDGDVTVSWGVMFRMHDTTSTTSMEVRQQYPGNSQLLPDWDLTLPTRYWVASIDGAGNMSPLAGPVETQPVNDTTPPSAPGAVQVVRRGKTSLRVRWAAAVDDIDVVEYRLDYRPHGTRRWRTSPYELCDVRYWTPSRVAGTVCITRMKAGQRYDVRIRACDVAWNCTAGAAKTVQTRYR